MAAPKKYPVDLTLAQLVALRDLVKTAHDSEAYYARQRLDEVAADDRWKTESILGARRRQGEFSALHEAVTGETLEPAVEADPTPVEVDADA